jgi:hypothetical protein
MSGKQQDAKLDMALCTCALPFSLAFRPAPSPPRRNDGNHAWGGGGRPLVSGLAAAVGSPCLFSSSTRATGLW